MFKCTTCGKSYSRKDSLLRHSKSSSHVNNNHRMKATWKSKLLKADSPNDEMDIDEYLCNNEKKLHVADGVYSIWQKFNKLKQTENKCASHDAEEFKDLSDRVIKNIESSNVENNIREGDKCIAGKDESLYVNEDCAESVNVQDNMTEGGDSNASENDSQYENVDSEEEQSVKSEMDDDNEELEVIYWNDPNKLVDRLRELGSTKIGAEIFAIIKALKEQQIIE